MPDRAAPPLTLWRAYVPQWAHAPLSGEGAARFGGRWNRVGEPALYAALELSTAWAEYNQGFVQHPALIATLRLSKARLVDLNNPRELSRLGIDATIHATEWRANLDNGTTPATHVVAARLRREGYDGLTYPSFMSPGGSCIALWRWNENNGPKLDVVDPDRRMPRSPASWTR
jgi:RES domain-containing protein